MKFRFLVLSFGVLVSTIIPAYTYAVGTAADAMCNPVIPSCPYMQVPGPKGCQPGMNMFMGPCQDVTNSFTTPGICIAPVKCQAVGTGAGKMDSSLSQLGQILGQLLQSLMKQSGGENGSGSGSSSGSGVGGPGTNNCTSYRQSSTPTNDPCAYYVPALGSTGTSTDLNSLINSITNSLNTATTATTTLPNSIPTSTSSNPYIGNSLSTNNANASSTPGSVIIIGKPYLPVFAATSSLTGNVEVTNIGATLFGVKQDVSNNFTVSGFYGADTTTNQPQAILARICLARPWVGNAFVNFIPETYFDGLCLWQGFAVGGSISAGAASANVVSGVIQANPITRSTSHPVRRARSTPTATSTPAYTGPAVPPKVQIWAVPPTVSIGKRTSIFWSSQGVSSCLETSPDGSFTQNTLSGGASTAPITTDTTYSISCAAPDGSPVTSYTTVHVGI